MRALTTRSILAGAVAAAALLGVGAAPSGGAQAVAPTTLYVAQGGTNSGACPSSNPCATITYALTQAGPNATIEVSGTIDDHVSISVPVTISGADAPAGSPAILNGTGNGTVMVIDEAAVTIDDLTIADGSGGDGGGISNPDGTLTVNDSTISGNASSNAGAGIFNESVLTITDSTISGNSAGGDGAGIYNWDGDLTATASTISGNTSATSGGGIYLFGGTVTAGATILAGNAGGNCEGSSGFVSVGDNLTDDATGTACGFTGPTDVVDKNPDLGPLADNGGLTQTLLPALSGPAVGVIATGTTLHGVPVCPGTDQRGFARPGPGESACSIGAVEVGLGATKVSLASSASPVTTGVAVIYTASVAPNPGGGTVKFASDGKAIAGCKARGVSPTTAKATCKVTYGTAGTHTIKAVYSGDARYAGSTSKNLTETVKA